MSFTLRPFQERALAQYRGAWKKSTSHLGIAPTAFGKTIVMGFLAKALVPNQKFRFVILAHREALVGQNADKVRRVAPELTVGIEQADQRAPVDADVISASVQTLRGARLARCAKAWKADGRPIFLITDEAHHATAKSYASVRQALEPARQLGLTATAFRPDDEDGSNLREVFPELAFKIPRGEMIDDGWLAKPRHWCVRTAQSLVGVKARAGDYVEADLDEALNVDARNELVLRTAFDMAEQMKADGAGVVRGVCFCLSVGHAYAMADIFKQWGWDARAISAETPIPDRRAADEALRTATTNTMLFNYGVLTEGWDVEEVNAGFFVRPTKSRILADQMLGRVLRFHADKPAAYVVDFEDIGAADRVSIASTFMLPTPWCCGGESLREDEKWFTERLAAARFTQRYRLWHCRTRSEVAAIVAEDADSDVCLVEGTGYMWWDLGHEMRMVLGTASLIVARTDFGDYAVTYRHGMRSRDVGRANSVEGAIAHAENWAVDNEANEMLFLRVYAGDTGEPATDAQVRFMTGLGVPPPADVTKKQARVLLNQISMEKARMAESGRVGFGKYSGEHVSAVPTSYISYALTKMDTWLTERRRPELHLFRSELARRDGGAVRSP